MYLLSIQRILFDSNNESACAFFFDLHREWLGEFGGTVNRFYVYCIQSNWDVSIIRSLETKRDEITGQFWDYSNIYIQ